MDTDVDSSDRQTDWERVDELLSAVLDLDPADRAGFLRTACEGEPRLRREVERLLRALDRADGFLERSGEIVSEVAREAFAEYPADLAPGRRVGPYRVVRQLGRGGMGNVFLAERADGAFQQRVALKILRRGLDTDDVVARFRRERQVLASLEHPNIARLLDGGATDDGRPYLVMEYVEGLPIDVYCDRRRLTVDARLRLFRRVLDAVAYAHRSLVVHRDLKPGNVLVSADCVPKLLDFGIAKLVARDERPGATVLTRTGVRLLSLRYASPEQLEGSRITTATDVYALGVMLYELITGHHPHASDEGERRSVRHLEQAITRDPPREPAKAVGAGRRSRDASGDASRARTPEEIARARSTRPAALRRRLESDLGVVLLKALRKEPERRYASAEEMSEELHRYASGRPVTARRDSWRYRASKFVRRHKAGVTAAALVVLSLVGGIAATTWQAHQASEAAEVARVEARNAREVSDLLVDLFRAPDAAEAAVGDTLTARAVLERGVERVRDELDDQPEVRARMLHVAGEVYRNLGFFDRGRPLLREALELKRELYGDEHPEVAESLEALAELYRDERDFQAAVPLHREELAIRRALHPDTALDVVDTAAGLAMALRDAGRPDTAVVVMREVLELKRRRLGPDHEETLAAQVALAYALRARGKLAEAESLYRDALPRMSRAELPPARMATTLNNLAYLLKVRGEPGDAVEAAELYRQALEAVRRAHGAGHPFSLTVMVNLAGALQAAGDTAGTEAVLRERLQATRASFPEDHWRVGSAAASVGNVLTRQRRHREAERYFREQLDIYEEALGPDHDWTVRARGYLGECLAAQGRHAEAEAFLLRGRADLSAEGELDRPWARGLLMRLVSLYEAWGKDDEARRYREMLAAVDSAGR